HETTTVLLELQPGLLQLVDLTKKPLISFAVGNNNDQVPTLRIRLADNGYQSINQQVSPAVIPTGEFVHKIPQLGQLPTGNLVLEIENQLDKSTPLWIRLAP